MIPQRTEEWHQQRLGRATASRFNDIMAGERLAGWRNYKADLVTERLTGKPRDSYTSREMQWGIDNEPLARLRYTLATGNVVEQCEFKPHPTLMAGASPDGHIVALQRGLELKCPNTATHLETLHSGRIPRQYYAQVQGQMWIWGFASADFASFDPRLPDNAALVVVHVERDEDYIADLETRVKIFLKYVEQEIEFVTNYTRSHHETAKVAVQAGAIHPTLPQQSEQAAA
jgi:putative phage-type endonuclease